MEKEIFDYEKILYDALFDINYYNPPSQAFKHKHLWVKKSAGLGVTEFFLRLMAWHVYEMTTTKITRCTL